MKFLPLLLLIVMLVSCKKNEIEADNRCVSLIADSLSRQLLSAQELDTLAALFAKNQLQVPANLRFSSYLKVDDGSKVFFADQFVNHQKVFIHVLGYGFNAQGTFLYQSGRKVTSISQPSQPASDPSFIRSMYVKELHNLDYPFPLSDSIQNNIAGACIQMEFGYLDTNLDDTTAQFVRAWHVYPSGNYSYRELYIADGTGRRIL